MTRTLAQEVLAILDEPRRDTGPISLAHLARRLGVGSSLIRSCARQLVAEGLVEASMSTQHGLTLIQGIAARAS